MPIGAGNLVRAHFLVDGLAVNRPSGNGSDSVVVIDSVSEQDALAQQVGLGAAVHMAFDHLESDRTTLLDNRHASRVLALHSARGSRWGLL